ncbi:hypothetical protein AABB24_038358, partial [Solanum stoloniferum]
PTTAPLILQLPRPTLSSSSSPKISTPLHIFSRKEKTRRLYPITPPMLLPQTPMLATSSPQTPMASPGSSPITTPCAPPSSSSEKRLWATGKTLHQSLILSNRPVSGRFLRDFLPSSLLFFCSSSDLASQEFKF